MGEGDKILLFQKFMFKHVYLFFIFESWSCIVKGDSNGKPEWCSGCYIFPT